MWPLNVVVPAVLGMALLSGCGGSDPAYSLGATFSCLDADGVAVTYHLDDSDYFVFDPIARAAGGGALHASFGETSVVVVFERSDGDAERTEAAYRAPRKSKPSPSAFELDDVLERRRNAVIVWLSSPTEQASGQVERCLR